jgi:hypothetical protein
VVPQILVLVIGIEPREQSQHAAREAVRMKISATQQGRQASRPRRRVCSRQSCLMTALVEKYRRISFDLRERKRQVEALKDQLWHLESAIRMFKEDYDFRSVVPKRTHTRIFLKRNIFLRTVMETMHEASEPLTAYDSSSTVGVRCSGRRFRLFRCVVQFRGSNPDIRPLCGGLGCPPFF